MNREALFCDGTQDYVIPAEPKENEKIKIRFRTAHNDVEEVHILTGNSSYPMWKIVSEGEFDFYEIEWQLSDVPFSYLFEVKSGDQICYFSRCGVSDQREDFYAFMIVPGFSTPEWAKGAVMYQIFVDRFCNGDPTNDVEDGEYIYIGAPSVKIKDWSKVPAAMDIRNFYGGDLQGVMDKLDYLQDLGVEVVYFNPLFVSPSNHKYDIQDYDYIDPHYGKIVSDGGETLPKGAKDNTGATKYQKRTGDIRNLEASNELFARLVEEMHKRGMRVILDGVFNHCGSFNKWIDRERIYEQQPEYPKGAYVSGESPYRKFFRFHDERKEAWPYNKSYDGWWGHDTLPKLNYEGSQELMDYVLHVAKKWVSPPYNVDGWRLDVAADLGHSQEFNHHFWQEFRKAVKEANPEAIILAEHYGNTRDWLQGNEWDTVMNYDAFMEPVTWFLTGMEKHSDDYREDLLGNAESFWGAMRHHTSSFSMPSWQVAMNELSNHDHSRFLTRTNHKVGRTNTLGPQAAEQGINKAVFREGVVIQMTWTGAPTIYYGDEAGVCGFTDPDNRRTYPWGHEDQVLLSFHKDIIRLRRENEELRTGSLKMLENDYNFISYGRFNRKGQCAILINNNNHPITKEIHVWEIGVPKTGKMKVILQSRDDGYCMEGAEYEIKAGKILIEMPQTSATILKYVQE